jgi:ligand-binding SRPBCC domain-containing protein
MKYRHTFRVRAGLADVADFHARATSLGAITPPVIPMRLNHAPERLANGDQMDFTMGIGPLSVRWVARVEDVSPSGFRDRQIQGPFEQWSHHHSFLSSGEGTTEIVDEVTAQLRRQPLWGSVGLAMWLGLPLLFAYRGWKTRRLLEGSVR